MSTHASPVQARAASGVLLAAALMLACGGGSGSDPTAPAVQPMPDAMAALEGRRIAGREEVLLLLARGVVAPLQCSELAHALLLRAFQLRPFAPDAQPRAAGGDSWDLRLEASTAGAAGAVSIRIEAADNAEGLMLRGEAGQLRATLRLERLALGDAAEMGGTIALEASRSTPGAGLARRSQADALWLADARQALRWSYLQVTIGAAQDLQSLNVVSALPMAGADEVWLDVSALPADKTEQATTHGLPAAGRYTANGVIGFLQARLALQISAAGAWQIDVDNARAGRDDLALHATPEEARRWTSSGLAGACAAALTHRADRPGDRA